MAAGNVSVDVKIKLGDSRSFGVLPKNKNNFNYNVPNANMRSLQRRIRQLHTVPTVNLLTCHFVGMATRDRASR